MASGLIDYLMRVEHISIAAAVWILLSVFCRLFPKLKARPLYARLAPALPLLLCSAAVWIPGIVDPATGVGSRIMLGIILGAVAANAHKILGQTVLGNDDRIRDGKQGDRIGGFWGKSKRIRDGKAKR